MTFISGKETLVGYIRSKHQGEKPQMLFVYGGGIATTQQFFENLASYVAEKGIPSLCFDYSGNGESTGSFHEASLEKRVQELKNALAFLDRTKPVSVWVSSMSGYIVLKALETEKIDILFLTAPALYAKNAYTVPFTEAFTNIIRRKNSWKNTDVCPFLESFTGKLFICIGESDTVIPEGVITLIHKHANNTREKKVVVLPGMNHFIVKATAEDKQLARQIAHMIIDFIHNN